MSDFNSENEGVLKNSSDFSFHSNRALYSFFCFTGILWVALSWQGLTTVVNVWYGNEIFNHGFFIVPGALYLIYLKRYDVFSQPIKTAPIALVVIIPTLLLYVIGVAGKVQLFMHIATFVLLPCLIWFVIGNRAVKKILFPLSFMLFSIPVGEQLIPFLQEIAATGSVALLRLSGVPLYRSGLFIEIPQGRFLVAEACSGVSFFIASFVIGSLYSYLNLQSVTRRITFVLISLVFPILANVLRVYGIIMIAYWTDMEYAAGADHLIYGWFFFAFVILCLLGIGEWMTDKKPLKIKPFVGPVNFKADGLFTGILSVLTLVSLVWSYSLGHRVIEPQISESLLTDIKDSRCFSSYWKPISESPDSEEVAFVTGSECKAKLYTAWFSENGNELVSGQHRLFDPKVFSLEDVLKLSVRGKIFDVYSVVSSSGDRRLLVRWFEVSEHTFADEIHTKLYQIASILVGGSSAGRVWVASYEGDDVNELKKLVESRIYIKD